MRGVGWITAICDADHRRMEQEESWKLMTLADAIQDFSIQDYTEKALSPAKG